MAAKWTKSKTFFFNYVALEKSLLACWSITLIQSKISKNYLHTMPSKHQHNTFRYLIFVTAVQNSVRMLLHIIYASLIYYATYAHSSLTPQES